MSATSNWLSQPTSATEPKPLTERQKGHRRRAFASMPFLRLIYVPLHFAFFSILKVAFVGLFVTLFLYRNYMLELPDVARLSDYRSPTITKIYNSSGQEVSRLSRENRINVSIEDIPLHVKQSFLSAEDKRFYEHRGVDPVSTVRAIFNNVVRGQRLVGASTITQQVAKIFFTDGDRTIERKIKEALLAYRLEEQFSKDEILELYLNEIFFGLQSYGIASASLRYFGKELKELSVSETAFLATLPKGPSNYHPVKNHEKATTRRDYVVGRMLANGFIEDWEAWAALKEHLPINIAKGYEQRQGDYAVDQVRRELINHFGEERVFEEGLIVQTSIDDELQRLAETALREGLEDYDRRHGWRGALENIDISRGDWRINFEQRKRPKGIGDYQLAVVVRAYQNSAVIAVQGGQEGRIPLNEMRWARPWRKNQKLGPAVGRVSQVVKPGDVILVEDLDRSVGADRLFALRQIPDVNGGLVAIDQKTGEVVASVGGYSFDRSQFNRVAQGKRQPGSTFKPFVYLTALNKGYSLNSSIKDQPLRIVFETGEVWEPKNAGGSYWGNVSLSNALMTSRNVPTVNIARDVTMTRIGKTAELFGFYDGLPNRLANSLGSQETTVMDVAGAYAMLARDGELVVPTTIRTVKTAEGETIFNARTGLCKSCLDSSPYIRRFADNLATAQPLASKGSIQQIRRVLRSVMTNGTGKRIGASLPDDIVGKTGTTNNANDAWFAGFGNDLVVAVYVGFDTPRTLGDKEQGGTVAAPIFRDFYLAALDAIGDRDPEFTTDAPKADISEPLVASTTPTRSASPTRASAPNRVTTRNSAARTTTRVTARSVTAAPAARPAQQLFGFQVQQQPVRRQVQQQPVYQQPAPQVQAQPQTNSVRPIY